MLALFAFDALIVLLPPLHWTVSSDTALAPVAYFLVTGVLVTASLLAMAFLRESPSR